MPFPIAPLAVTAVKYGGVALAAYAMARRLGDGRTDQRAEDALDDVDDGLHAHRPRDRAGQINAAGRLRRVIRLGADGPGLAVDAGLLARLRVRRA